MSRSGMAIARAFTRKGFSVDKAEIDTRFTYHPPTPGQPEKYEAIRKNAREMAYLLYAVAPESRELSLALTSLDEVVFWANAAVARRG